VVYEVDKLFGVVSIFIRSDESTDCIQVSDEVQSGELWRLPLGNYPVEGHIEISKALSYFYKSKPNISEIEHIGIIRRSSRGDGNYFHTAEYHIQLEVNSQ